MTKHKLKSKHGKDTLECDECIESKNGQYRAVMQGDGNFVVYNGDEAIFATDTCGQSASRICMQKDGNLVIYDGDDPKWATDTCGDGKGKLKMQDDGNLVIYSADSSSDDEGPEVIWASETCGGGRSTAWGKGKIH